MLRIYSILFELKVITLIFSCACKWDFSFREFVMYSFTPKL